MTVEEEKIPVQNLFSSSMKTWRLFGFSAKSIFQEWRAPSQELLVHKRGRLKSWDSSNRKSKKVTKLRHEVFESTEEDILIYIYIYKTSQIVAMFSCTVSSLWRNLNQMNRLEDKGLLFRNLSAWRTSQTVAMFLRKVRESCVGISPAYRSYSAPGWNIYAKLSIFWLFSHAKVEN